MCCTLGPCAPSRPVFAAQVGAFKDRARADALAANFPARYQQTMLVAPVTVKDQTFYRVRFLAETKADAKTLAATLRQNDNQLACVVVPLPQSHHRHNRADNSLRQLFVQQGGLSFSSDQRTAIGRSVAVAF